MYLIFDTETTGRPVPGAPADHPAQPYIMQLGAALVGDDFKITQELDILIQLPEGVEPHPEAFEAHGITAAQCATGAAPEVAHNMFEALATKAHTLVCHNYQFDAKLWAIFCARHGFTNPVRPALCTMELMTPIMKLPHRGARRGAYKWPKCQEAYGYITGGQQFANAHNALADVRATVAILGWLANKEQLPRALSEAKGRGEGTATVQNASNIHVTATGQVKVGGHSAAAGAPAHADNPDNMPAVGSLAHLVQGAGFVGVDLAALGADKTGRPAFQIPIAHIQTK